MDTVSGFSIDILLLFLSHVEQISTLQPVEEHLVEQVEVAWRRLQPMESPRRSRPRAGAAARGEEPTQEQVTRQELLPVGDPGWSTLLLTDGFCGMDSCWSSS